MITRRTQRFKVNKVRAIILVVAAAIAVYALATVWVLPRM